MFPFITMKVHIIGSKSIFFFKEVVIAAKAPDLSRTCNRKIVDFSMKYWQPPAKSRRLDTNKLISQLEEKLP